jgi:HK97 family phage prohead protease
MKINLSAGFAIDLEAAAGDSPTRQISGIAVPYDVPARVSDGTMVQFSKGSLPVDGKAPKMYMYHDSTQPVGLVTSRMEASDGSGMLFVASIVDTQAGTDALTMASAGVLDSVSVGVNVVSSKKGKDGLMIITAAEWLELSLVPQPAFSGSIITDVAASIPTSEDEISNNNPEAPDEPEVTEPQENPVSEPIIEASAPEQIPTNPLFASVQTREPRLPSAAEFMAAQFEGGERAQNQNKVWADYRAFHDIKAAAGDEVLSNVGGIVPVHLLGPVFANLNYISPVLSALGTRAMPGGGKGSTFTRPTWTTHPTVAQQSAELDAVSATTAVIAANTVTKVTFAGSANLSYQVIDFTDPAALEVILTDLAGQYLDAVDNYAADNLLTAATSAGVWDLSVTDLMKSIYDAAVVTSSATNFLPTNIFVDPATWGAMMQLVDTTGRPIFGYTGGGLNGYNTLGQGNASTWTGANPLGLDIVVDKNFAAKTMVIMARQAFEIYREDRGVLSVESPTALSRVVSVYGYAATFKANANMIQKITQA